MVRPRTVKEKSMPDYQSLTHTRWDCKYHVVFIPKRRQKLIYGKLRKYLGEIFHELAKRRGVEIVEGHMMMDHVHMCISIPPKYSVANTVGYIKGKSAIAIACKFRGKQWNFNSEHFWARGYFVSTVGLDEMVVREYIRDQERNDAHREQLMLGM
jgi:putative transposase